MLFVCGAGVTEPQIIVINSSMVDIHWITPSSPNGLITTYRLYRSSGDERSVLIYSGASDVYNMVDASVQPGVQYSYAMEAVNAAGATNSSSVIVTLPVNTPASVPAITNFTALSAHSVYIEWQQLPNSSVDQYRVLINAETAEHLSERPANATLTSLVIAGLRPHTWYSARLAACIRGVPNGCGTNPVSQHVRTWEEPPTDQPPPVLTSTGPTTVIVSWEPPDSPNGVTLLYRIRRREWVSSGAAASGSGVLVSVVNGSVQTFVNAGIDLTPFTVYEYSITAVNSQGETSSNWTAVRTLAAPPQGMLAPSVSTVGSYSFSVSWEPPSQPNGQIDRYQLEYTEKGYYDIGDVSRLNVPGTINHTSISGVQPYTNHSVRVRAVNSAGSTVSRWTNFTTLPAPPSGLSALSVEPVSGGRSAILSWTPPTQPNGRILNYAVYRDTNSNAPVYHGVGIHFELGGLEPYTNYSIQLEACTVAGCSRSPWQTFVTSQAPPANQRAPSISFVNSSSVLITWNRPAKTFGDVLSYQVLRQTLPVISTRTRRSIVQYEVIYTTTDTAPSQFSFLDTSVLPYTRYANLRSDGAMSHNCGYHYLLSNINTLTLSALQVKGLVNIFVQ